LLTLHTSSSTFGQQTLSASGGSLVLDANTDYWVIMNGQGTFDGAFEQNSQGDNSPSAGRSGTPPGAWTLHAGEPNFAIQVDGRALASTPEPGSIALLGGGVLALLAGRRYRRNQ